MGRKLEKVLLAGRRAFSAHSAEVLCVLCVLRFLTELSRKRVWSAWYRSQAGNRGLQDFFSVFLDDDSLLVSFLSSFLSSFLPPDSPFDEDVPADDFLA